MYTVTFDSTLYDNQVEELPILVSQGYGVLFYFTDGVKGTKEHPNFDPQVKETIQEIFIDFLRLKGDETFIVYQCEAFKQSRIFNRWIHCPHLPRIKGAGLFMQADDQLQFIGYLGMENNKHHEQARNELAQFSVKLSMDGGE